MHVDDFNLGPKVLFEVLLLIALICDFVKYRKRHLLSFVD